MSPLSRNLALVLVALVSVSWPGVRAYPDYFAQDFAETCTDQPTRGYSRHGAPTTDA